METNNLASGIIAMLTIFIFGILWLPLYQDGERGEGHADVFRTITAAVVGIAEVVILFYVVLPALIGKQKAVRKGDKQK